MADGRRRRRFGVVARLTAAATAVVAVALVVGAVVFWAGLRLSLTSQLASAAQQDAAALARQLDALEVSDGDDGNDGGGDDGDPEASALDPADREVIEAVLPDVDDDRFFQVIARESGAVVAASDAAEEAPALSDRDATPPGDVRLAGEEDTYVTAVERDGDWVVVAGRGTAQAEETLATVGAMLAVAVPVLVAIVAVTAWLTARRALAPVERMRREVAAVSGSDLSRRVAEPDTADEIGRLARTMNDMLSRLEASATAQRRFISDASHELKSPLASLRQFGEVARQHPDRVGQAELTDAVLEEGARLERLVQGMLTLARADERALPLHLTDVDLDDLLFAEARRLSAARVVATDASGVTPVRVRGDRALLQQVVRNLADNAARHARGRVAFTAVTDASGPTLTVDDDGPGIPPDERERVFERFVRLDDARARGAGGSGLGLSIVRELVTAHGGSVSIAESPLGGVRVVVRLPA